MSQMGSNPSDTSQYQLCLHVNIILSFLSLKWIGGLRIVVLFDHKKQIINKNALKVLTVDKYWKSLIP